MRKKTLAFVFAAAVLVAMAVPLFGGVGTAEAIVHGSTPIIDAGAVGASEGSAGGTAAIPVLTDQSNPAPEPPMPSQAGTTLPTP